MMTGDYKSPVIYKGEKMKDITVTGIEQGYNFVTLYFKTVKDKNSYSDKLYNSFKNNFEYFSLQRRKFAHQPGDIPQFHAEGGPKDIRDGDWHHFHIIYPREVTEQDWDFLYIWGNRKELILNRELEKRKIEGRYSGVEQR